VRKCEIEIKKLEKLTFIPSCYKGSTIEEAATNAGISIPAAYRWLNKWNWEGLDSINPKKGTGWPSKLTDEDKIQLKETMINTEHLTTQKLHDIILNDFNIDYSLKQTRIIAHQLGFSYYKPDSPFVTGPVDAELRPKETFEDN